MLFRSCKLLNFKFKLRLFCIWLNFLKLEAVVQKLNWALFLIHIIYQMFCNDIFLILLQFLWKNANGMLVKLPEHISNNFFLQIRKNIQYIRYQKIPKQLKAFAYFFEKKSYIHCLICRFERYPQIYVNACI